MKGFGSVSTRWIGIVCVLALLGIVGLLIAVIHLQSAAPAQIDAWLVDFQYPEQRDTSYSFSHPASNIFLPIIPSQRSIFSLRVQSPLPLAPRLLTIGYNQQDVATLRVGEHPRVVQLLLPTASEKQTDGLVITVNTPAAMVPGDNRELGLLFNMISVHPFSSAYMGLLSKPVQQIGSYTVSFGIVALLIVIGLYRWVVQRRVATQAHIVSLNNDLAKIIVPGVLCLTYGTIMSYYSITRHDLYGSHAYDLGLYDQVLWLLSRYIYPYSTGMGVHTLGNHASVLLYPLSLLYRIDPDVRALLITQSLVIGLGAVPIYWLGKDWGSSILGIVVAATYLLHPAIQNANLSDFHPDTLAATALLFAIWAAERRRMVIVLICCGIVMAAKENFSLTVIIFGFWLAVWKRDWKWGLLVLGSGLCWFLVSTQFILPHFNGLGHSIHLLERYAQYGDSVSAIGINFLLHPAMLLAPLGTPEAFAYIWQLCAPFGLLCLFSPQYLVIAVPALILNLLSVSGAQRMIIHHYHVLIVAVAAIASLRTLAAIRVRFPRKLTLSMSVLLLAGSVIYALNTDDLRIGEVQDDLAHGSARSSYYNYMLSLIPSDAGIAAQNTIQPHLTHRVQAFLFPNPFQQAAFFNLNQMPYTASVDYIIFDTKRIDTFYASRDQQVDLLRALQERQLYAPIARLDGIVLLRRSPASLPVDCFGQRWEAFECRP